MRTLIAISLLFIFWFLLSGHTETLLILLGLASTLLTALLAKRMRVIDHESYPVHLSLRLLRFYVYLGKEIVLSNLDVIKRILQPGRSISPTTVDLPASKRSNLAKVVYANSITLTPGTVTLALSDQRISVHALTRQAAEQLQSGAMAEAVPDDAEQSS